MLPGMQRRLISFTLIILFLPAFVSADEVVAAIEVRGNVRVSDSAILADIQTEEGQKFLPVRLSEDVRRLYETGAFADIRVEREATPEGIKLIFQVTEKYVVSKIIFSGNKAFRDKKLGKELSLSEGNTYDNRKLKDCQDKITSVYREAGFAGALVSSEVEERKEERDVLITFTIDEGVSARAREVSIEGNEVLSDREIKKIIKTGKGIFRKGVFREDVLGEDKERILYLYRSHGYIKAKIPETKLAYDEEGKRVYVTIYVDEGDEYIVGKVDLEKELKEEVKLHKGSPFSPDELRKDIGRVYDYLYGKGYLYAFVNANRRISEEQKRVDIEYEIKNGPVVYIGDIRISGNVRTKDKIIRREILVSPGDRFDIGKIKGSQRKIRNLGSKQPFFDRVIFEIEDTDVQDKKNLHFKVTEGKTGTFLFGGGYSSVDKFIGFVEVNIENFDIANPPAFTGGGQSLSVHAEAGTDKANYSLSFTEPWLFDKPLSCGFDLYDRLREWDEYDEGRDGGKIRFGYPIGEFNSVHARYKYEDVEISGLGDVSDEIRREEGVNTTSSLSLILVRDTRDNRFSPRHGGRNSISTEFAGDFFGGDRDFTKHTGKMSWYFPAWKESSLNLRLELGLVEEFGSSEYVPVYERFYMGGADTVRGYAYRDIGPKDEFGEPIGGEFKTQANIEYTIPIVKDFKGAVFYDVGNVWKSKDDFDFGDLYSGVGVGIRLTTPIGPLRLDYGYGIDISKGRLHFTMGWPF